VAMWELRGKEDKHETSQQIVEPWARHAQYVV